MILLQFIIFWYAVSSIIHTHSLHRNCTCHLCVSSICSTYSVINCTTL